MLKTNPLRRWSDMQYKLGDRVRLVHSSHVGTVLAIYANADADYTNILVQWDDLDRKCTWDARSLTPYVENKSFEEVE